MQYVIVSLGLVLSLLARGLTPGAEPITQTRSGFAGDLQSAAPEQPDRRRLLHLADGSVLRARSRTDEGVWQVRQGRSWEALEQAVLEQYLEREVAADAKRRAAGVARGDHDARVAVAAWMVGAGLEVEALETLNRILSKSSDHPGALALIATGRIELDLEGVDTQLSSARLKALLAAGAKGPAAESELAVRGLAACAGRVDLRSVFTAELRHPGNRHRAFAVLVVRRLFAGEFTDQLVERALWDRYETVREPAARALARMPETGAMAALVGALAHEHSVVRLHAIEAMSRMGSAGAIEPLVVHLSLLQSSAAAAVGTRANLFIGGQRAIVRDYDVEIAQGQSIADPIVGVVESGVILDVRAVAQITRAAEQRAVTMALHVISGEPVGAKPAAWLEWWDMHQKARGQLESEGAASEHPHKG
ncbi:MAG: hypothetical protein ACI8QZ_002769 [Chlamydiales bacterium]|jgi:hypothetical protein